MHQNNANVSGNVTECPFVEKLKRNEWAVLHCTAMQARSELQRLKPSVVLFDHKIGDLVTTVGLVF